MAKTSHSIGVLVRDVLWQVVCLKLLPFLLAAELVRAGWRWLSSRNTDA